MCFRGKSRRPWAIGVRGVHSEPVGVGRISGVTMVTSGVTMVTSGVPMVTSGVTMVISGVTIVTIVV